MTEPTKDIHSQKEVFFMALRCLFGIHSWTVYQENFEATRGPVVIAWQQCQFCGKSKLIHILR